MLETTLWLINHSAFSSSHWMTGDLDPNSPGQKETPQPFCPEARMPVPYLSLLIFCTKTFASEA